MLVLKPFKSQLEEVGATEGNKNEKKRDQICTKIHRQRMPNILWFIGTSHSSVPPHPPKNEEFLSLHLKSL